MSIEKEFVPYAEALALKELGFDQPCFAYWNADPFLSKPFLTFIKPFEHEWCIPNPLYSQAFRWFREKYKYNTEIVWMTAVNFKYSARVKSKLGTDYIDEHGTYEEAELACLRKLIEIVKQKNNNEQQ